MSKLDEVTARTAPVQVIADVALVQRREWAERVLDGRETLWLDDDRDAVATLARALDADALPGAVGWVAGLEHVSSLETAERLLRDVLERGTAVVVGVPNTRLDAGFTSRAGLELGWDEARALASALGAELVEQHLGEAALIGEAGDSPLQGELVGAAAEPDDACAWLLVAGTELTEAATRLQFNAQPVHRAYLAALEAANAELERANARLARANLGRHDAGAASVVGRIEHETEQALSEARAEVARLEARLALEVEVAAQNDRFFQDARATLAKPEHRAASAAIVRAKRVPGARFAARVVKKLVRR